MKKTLFPVMLRAENPSQLAEDVDQKVKNGYDLYTQPFVTHEGKLCQYVVENYCLYEYALIHAQDLYQFDQQVQALSAIGFDFIFGTVLWNGGYIQWMCRINEIGLGVRDTLSAAVDEKFQEAIPLDVEAQARYFANQLRVWNKSLQETK